ncbi:MAG: hypothetical protein NXH85_12815 [Pseudomonadaceae bacterium]|nr:hypothetical protein [Pseudomonadaceae bacterium]
MTDLSSATLGWLLLAQALIFAALVLALLMALSRLNRTDALVEQLSREISVYVETSVELAACVDRRMNDGAQPMPSRSSRRELLAQARARRDGGLSMAHIATSLELSEDEQALLAIVPEPR